MDVLGLWLAASALARAAGDDAEWMERLRLLDDARAAAFVRADPSLLDDVYPPRSAERRADERTVSAYAERGLELEDVRFDLLAFGIESRSQERVVLRVVDRLAPVRVRRPGGAWRALPRDRPTERRITLVETVAGWRIGSVDRVAG